MRYIVDRVKQIDKKADTYIYEQTTRTYRALKGMLPDLIGSEFLSPEMESGSEKDGILHEDAMNLSFTDNAFDLVISCDVFEHVSDYRKAFLEAYRILKPGGGTVNNGTVLLWFI